MIKKEGQSTRLGTRSKPRIRRLSSFGEGRSTSKTIRITRQRTKSISKIKIRPTKKASTQKSKRKFSPTKTDRPPRPRPINFTKPGPGELLFEDDNQSFLGRRKVMFKVLHDAEPLLDLDEEPVVIPPRKYLEQVVHGPMKEEECSICLELFERDISALECGHMFHTECINDWLTKRRVCPICNEAVRRLTIQG